jgi:hypothetical protein
MIKKTVSFKQLATWDSPSLCTIIESWQEYDSKSVLLIYAELNKRKFEFPPSIIKCIREYCIYHKAEQLEPFVDAYIKNQGYVNYDEYYEKVVAIKGFIIDDNQSINNTETNKSKGYFVKVLAIVAVIMILAIASNPSIEKHQEAIKIKVKTIMQQSFQVDIQLSANKWEQAGQELGLMIGGALLDPIIENIVSTDNYLFFSITKITWKGETNAVGIGIFGNVFVNPKIDAALNDKFSKKNDFQFN